jgi:hypothetical protein
MISKGQIVALWSPMFCKHFKHILVSGQFDIHFTVHAEVKHCHYVTITTRILIHNIINQITEVGSISIHDFVQAIPPSTTIRTNNPDF